MSVSVTSVRATTTFPPPTGHHPPFHPSRQQRRRSVWCDRAVDRERGCRSVSVRRLGCLKTGQLPAAGGAGRGHGSAPAAVQSTRDRRRCRALVLCPCCAVRRV